MIKDKYDDKNWKNERGLTRFDILKYKRDQEGNTPLDLAYKEYHWSVCQLLTDDKGFEHEDISRRIACYEKHQWRQSCNIPRKIFL